MIAPQRVITEADRRDMDRQAALYEVLTCTAGLVGLSHAGERDIREAAMRLFEPILHLADDAVAARLEYEAIDGQMDRHVRGHEGCTRDQPCLRFRLLQIRRERLWKAWAKAYRALVGGRR